MPLLPPGFVLRTKMILHSGARCGAHVMIPSGGVTFCCGVRGERVS